ncbi:hypothetical protein SISSUDRAFT_1133093 [Sistotremastrum suecicum HHB10207 ss-3]|uniref:P-loop containing nucleoside triphosphate hydrolase protein n=1 Tax=Sistotremastrum suecicum HHB10207 ss-3 TaxID=1314776 RepID=A0A165XUU4_9AGAM|nr:hypothetical protein SISSUDRAFT_1133093 [Sistotremastrum suecicum HHB10207 ss-3]
MRRSPVNELAVDVPAANDAYDIDVELHETGHYHEHEQEPEHDGSDTHSHYTNTYPLPTSLPTTPVPPQTSRPPSIHPSHAPSSRSYTPPAPSIKLLFSFCSKRDLWLVLLPAIGTSVIAGGVAPFMTVVLGQGFDAFSSFPQTPNPPQSAKDTLLHNVGIAALELVALSVGALALSTVMSSLWILVGERNVLGLRRRVYEVVTGKDMEWFDLKMGGAEKENGDDASTGAGGLMAQFAKDTDDVRTASSLTTGIIIQNLVTVIAALALAFRGSWSLTLVILSTIPIMLIIQTLSQIFATPLLAVERGMLTQGGDQADSAFKKIATVKAFNAAEREFDQIEAIVDYLESAMKKCVALWGLTSGLSQFTCMTMFVQGFWFGSKLVRDGKATPGGVMAVFWACLIATNNLQLILPHLVILTKGKSAMVALITLIEAPAPQPEMEDLDDVPLHSAKPISLISTRSKSIHNFPELRKIVPSAPCKGEFSLNNVTFAYPSRPTAPVLTDVSLFLPSGETTFIVGGSGSGKSTIAQLLLRLYEPQFGSIDLDDQSLHHLDESWTSQNVALVSQSCILFDMTVHQNVAMGLAGSGSRKPEDATREEVVAACRAALMHEFIRDLPDGYDTRLGNGGASLSGGQKQRLAIARARMRDPTVLILDECTSALDPTSRVLVFEALKAWRRNRTTIVITHDLSQITQADFVYVLKNGEVVEQGYRLDLEMDEGEFRRMADAQSSNGFPSRDDGLDVQIQIEKDVEVEAILEHAEEKNQLNTAWQSKHHSMGVQMLRPVTMSNWMFEAISDLTRSHAPTPIPPIASKRLSAVPETMRPVSVEPATLSPRRMSFTPGLDTLAVPQEAHYRIPRPASLQFTPTSPISFSKPFMYTLEPPPLSAGSLSTHSDSALEEEDQFEDEKQALERSGVAASRSRLLRSTTDPLATKPSRLHWHHRPANAPQLKSVVVEKRTKKEEKVEKHSPQVSLLQLARTIYPTIPKKYVLFIGLLCCIATGAMTPLFSFMLSKLLFEVSTGAKDVSYINKLGGITLAIAAADGIFGGSKFWLMETSALMWMTNLRKKCFNLILAQDKKWFDKPENSSQALVQTLFKDSEDAKGLVGLVIGQATVVFTMLSVGLIWALILGWQLTLAGLAIGPVFAGVMSVQSTFVSRFHQRNKLCREDIAKGYYEAISNIRGIRSMAFQGIFREQYEKALQLALRTGLKSAFVEGCNIGVASALIYLAEALLFYVGAVLVANGTYTYLRMVQVLQLVVFSVSIASQLMVFTGSVTKAVQGTRDLYRILSLTTDTDESRGNSKPLISGSVSFKNVEFSYPERPDVPILKGVSLDVTAGECVAIVGSSGSGKSTITSLLQRLYEPNSGAITVENTNLSMTDVTWLRDHVAVVSQDPHLFEMTISDNIAYGDRPISDEEVEEAAKASNVHDFIMSLPKGYDTQVGENASLISGGQAQRLQIARALVRGARILILDECTSALDAENQAAVMDTIRQVKVGRTTIVVTHKLSLMKMCDRILVIHDGVVAEEGTFDSLTRKKGVFSQLASGGEWATD